MTGQDVTGAAADSTDGAFLVPAQPVPGLDGPAALFDGATIGRGPENSLRIQSPSVSRHHARITVEDGEFFLSDLGSKNGTFVSGRRITGPARLADGDCVAFAGFEFRAVIPPRGGASAKPEMSPAAPVALVDDARGAMETMVRPMAAARMEELLGAAAAERAGGSAAAKRAADRLRALCRAGALLRSHGDIAAAQEQVLALIFEAAPARRGAVFLDTDRTGRFEGLAPVAFRRADGEPEGVLNVSRTILRRCFEERAALLVRDTALDDRFSAAQSIVVNDIRAAVAVPLLSGEQVLGIVYLDADAGRGRFDEEDLSFLSALCGEIALNLEHARLQREISRSERLAAIGQTITGAAHNVKNLLQLAQGGLDLLGQTLEDGDLESSKSCYAAASSGLRQLGQLVRDMLDYARGGTGSLERTDLAALAHGAAETARAAFGSEAIVFEERIAPVPPVLADPQSLHRAFENIFVNAMDALKDQPQGQVTLTTGTTPRGWASVRIEDNGPGIPQAQIERIFDPFFSTKGPGGTGLGLAITRKAVADCGGTIRAESGQGRGAAFIIELPPAE